MMRLWRDLRTNMMYWRFRHVTRNRLRLKSWWARRRPNGRRLQPGGPTYARPFERGLASRVYGSSQRRSLTAFAALVILLTALSALANRVFISPGLVYLIGTLIIIGCIYYALRSV
jgi:hypothetical protein